LYAVDKDETILIVSHGACIRFLSEAFANKEAFDIENWDDDFGIKVMRNTSCHLIRITKANTTGGDNSTKAKVKFDELHNCSHIPQHMLENDSLTRMVNNPETACLSGCFQV